MLLRTHISFSIFVFLLFFESFKNSLVFFIAIVIGSFFPDIDTKFSSIGKRKKYRIIQYFFSHRGFLHSLTFLPLFFPFLFIFSRDFSFGFCVGFLLHIFLDSFTKKGIFLFYPLNFRINGFFKTGGFFDLVLFLFFIIIDLFLLISRFLNYI